MLYYNNHNDFHSDCYNKAKEIERRIIEDFSLAKKENYHYEIICYGAECNTIVLFHEEEALKFVKITDLDPFIQLDYLHEEDKEINQKFIDKQQMIIDEYQRYLANEFGFTGRANIQALRYRDKILAFNLTVSGKGTTDEVFNLTRLVEKKLAKKININRLTPDSLFDIFSDCKEKLNK